MDNVGVARLFDEIADLLEIESGNPFRVRAYRTAARTIEALGEPASAIAARDPSALAQLPGIGRDLAAKVVEILATGDLALHRELVAKVPASLVVMMRVAGVGPKRAKLFYDQLGLKTLDDLEVAAKQGTLRSVRGIGEILEKRILQGCAEQRARSGRFRLAEADAHAAPLLAYLGEARQVVAIDLAGSLRHRRETIGDIDVLVASTEPTAVAERFLRYPEVTKVLAHGRTKCSVALRSGMQADLRIVAPESYGAALHYFTGSKAHSIAVRTLGVRRKLKINEYGVFRGKRRVGGRTEEEVFRAVGLPWMPPELREDHGEIDAARAGQLPLLIELGDLRGDLHLHTDASDGSSTLREMVEAASARGYAYIAITDHTQALRVTGGLDRGGFRRQRRAIHALRREFPGTAILHGAEVDILEGGGLDLDEETLAELDVVVAAVHSRFAMTEAAMTERIISALAHPRVNILAHPTGRLLGKREPYAVDMAKVVKAACDRRVLLEINAQPERLDLSDAMVRMARDAGAQFVIDTDAHRTSELEFMRYGVDQARRGWCSAKDVANARPLDELLALLRRATPPAPAARPRRAVRSAAERATRA
jgi:DNA polymerase (family X)